MKHRILILLFAISTFSSCYYNNEDDLRPIQIIDSIPVVSCDTSVTISYSKDIVPIMNGSCGAHDNNCHSTGNTSSGIALDNYPNITDVIISGSFMGSILHESGYKPMPQGGGMLDECSINKIKSWINHSYPNN